MRGLMVLFLPVLVVRSSSQDPSGTSRRPADPICGFVAGPHYSFESEKIRQGLTVDLLVGKAQVNQPVTLRFLVTRKPGNYPVDKLQIEHEKFIHVIGVREDLGEFFHVHPTRTSPGVWEVTHTFRGGGNFKIWSEVKFQGVSYSFGHPLLSVAGLMDSAGRGRDWKTTRRSSGYEINLQPVRPWQTSTTNQFQFTIRSCAGKQIGLESFLGAPMHLVIVSDDLSVLLHAHPEGRWLPGSAIRFSQVFPREGSYRFFAQFRPDDARLPAGDAMLAEFDVAVPPRAAP